MGNWDTGDQAVRDRDHLMAFASVRSPDTEPVWYHGTRVGVKPGGMLMPAADHHKHRANLLPHGDGVHDEPGAYLYLTPDPDIAALFALSANGRGAPKVCTVEPWGDVVPDAATLNGEDGYLWRTTEWAKVIAVHPAPQAAVD